MSKKRDIQKKTMEGYLPPTWNLKVINLYGKDLICPTVFTSNGIFHHPIRPQKFSNDERDYVKVRITIEELKPRRK